MDEINLTATLFILEKENHERKKVYLSDVLDILESMEKEASGSKGA